MKKMFHRLLAIFLLALGLATSVYAAEGKALVIGQAEGVVIHKIAGTILQKAYQNAGIPMKFKIMPSNRSLILANDGMFDGDAARIDQITEKYSNLRQVPTPLMPIDSYAFGIDPSMEVNQWSDLQDLRIGLKYGLRYMDINTEGMQREFFSSFETAFEMLVAHRIDVVICSEVQAQIVIQKYFQGNNIHKLGEAVYQAPLYHFLHQKHTDLIPTIDKYIQELYDSGQHEELLQQAINDVHTN